MDATKVGAYVVELTAGYDFVEISEEEFDAAQEGGEFVIQTAGEVHRRRELVEAQPDGRFSVAQLAIRDPAQIPLSSLMRYAERAVLERCAPSEHIVALRPDRERSTADARDVDNVGRKLATFLDCDYVEA